MAKNVLFTSLDGNDFGLFFFLEFRKDPVEHSFQALFYQGLTV